MWMRDPYFYENIPVLRNKLNIYDQKLLELEEDVLGGQSVEYSDPFDIIKDIHHELSI